MGSQNSTDSVSSAPGMLHRFAAGLRNFARAVYSAAMRVARRPIPRIETEKEVFVVATERDTFVWNVARGKKGSSDSDLPPLFVRVEPDPVIEESEDGWSEGQDTEKVYSTPSYSTISSPTSSGAVMYEFSSSRFELDVLDMEDSNENEVIDAPVFMERYESEEERQFFESLYEDLAVEAVLDYMDTIDLYAFDYDSLYEDLAVEAVLDYMDTIDLYHADKKTDIEAEEPVTTIAGYIEAPVSVITGYIEAPVSQISGLLSAPVSIEAEPAVETVSDEYVETEEERRFFESVYEDLTVFAVLDYMDTIELYARPAPEYVISEIGVSEICETEIRIEPRYVPDYVISEIVSAEECETIIEIEQPAVEPMPVKQSILAQFVFGFDVPVRSSAGPTRFRFIAGAEEESEDDVEDVQVMTYSGDAAVSAQSFSNGPLAL